jgi:spermidine synthase
MDRRRCDSHARHRRLACVDIEPALFDFVGNRVDSPWRRVPRTRVIVEDGRTYLRHGPARYDIISLELGQPFRPGVAYFYTHEAYEFARARLNPNGLAVQFVPLAFFTPEQFRQVVRTFLDVFPQTVLLHNTEVLLVGANAARFPLAAGLLTGADDREVSSDLDFAYWGLAESLNRPEVLSVASSRGLRTSRGLPTRRSLHDDRPMLDYATAGVDPVLSNEIANARIRDSSPLPAELGSALAAELRDRAAAIQARNAGDIAAASLTREASALEARGDAEAAIAALRQALEWNDENVQANLRLGDLLFRRDRPDLALPRFATAVRMLPGHAAARHGLAMSLHRTGRIAEAIPQYQRAVPLDPANAELHNNFGAALAELGLYEDAREHFKEAVRLRPTYGDAHRNLEAVEGVRR